MTDAVCAAGFQANFVIVIGNKYGLNSAASRAITQVAFHEFPLKKGKKVTLTDIKKRLLKSANWNDTIHDPYHSALNVIMVNAMALLNELPKSIIDTMKQINDLGKRYIQRFLLNYCVNLINRNTNFELKYFFGKIT